MNTTNFLNQNVYIKYCFLEVLAASFFSWHCFFVPLSFFILLITIYLWYYYLHFLFFIASYLVCYLRTCMFTTFFFSSTRFCLMNSIILCPTCQFLVHIFPLHICHSSYFLLYHKHFIFWFLSCMFSWATVQQWIGGYPCLITFIFFRLSVKSVIQCASLPIHFIHLFRISMLVKYLNNGQ